MRISWISEDKDVPSKVEYGKISGIYNAAAKGEHTSYSYFFYSSGKTPRSTFPLEFVVVGNGSYTDFDEDLVQYKWLVSDLGKVDRKKTPWIIVLLHAPWYNTNLAHKGEG
ncbi:hypothetical protein PTKIN_Ptkin06aG0057100 [Pterospermum kingtungense]